MTDFKKKEFLEKYKIGNDTRYRTTWVYVGKTEVMTNTPEEPIATCPEGAEEQDGKCMMDCEKTIDSTIEDIEWIEEKVEVTKNEDGIWSEPARCEVQNTSEEPIATCPEGAEEQDGKCMMDCVQPNTFTLINAVWIDEQVEITKDNDVTWSEPRICNTKCVNDEYTEDTNANPGEIKCTKVEDTCVEYDVQDPNIKWLIDPVSESDNRCKYVCADDYHPEIISEDGNTTSGEIAPPDMEKFNPGDEIICIKNTNN